jgi:predicted RNA-binding protein YlxR (DUF448 family)
MQQITVSLEESLLVFIDRYAAGDRSAYIHHLLAEYRRAKLSQEIRLALQADVNNPDYQAELELWDGIVGDGWNAER